MYTDLEQTSAGLGQRGRKPYLGEGLRELQPRPPPLLGKFSTCLATHVCPFLIPKIILYKFLIFYAQLIGD